MPKMLISNVLIDDLICESDPELEGQPQAEIYIKALRSLLRPALNQVIKACKTPVDLQRVAAEQSDKMSICRTTSMAYRLFLANLAESDDVPPACFQNI
ncbi:hypothetical protein CAP31_08605 [Sulfuriferula sp. AH1]|uniref:hypothetical protein n=1 Tax=Sulfuriferula sp. AH1 TaxID=1985873 RepID=UPI000B3B65E2|nr:hypothetical protein [Sulfuriferula sp. AH1]ARU31734.1 hypothetical protein CAP31_08605 [Sulfuriferula sp. AH1]